MVLTPACTRLESLHAALRAKLVLPSLAVIGLLLGRPAAAAEVTLSMIPVAPIDARLFGVNYVWHLIPEADFAMFQAAMRDVAHAAFLRYPGGWAAERLDWSANEEIAGDGKADGPGIGPDAFAASGGAATFVTPSAAAIRDPSQTPALIATVTGLVRRYGGRVKVWEIGNEWWLQRGAKTNPEAREQNLEAYGALLAAMAPAMKAADPSVELFATGDWTRPQDFARLRRLAGPAWSQIAGVSVHPYCGVSEQETLCSRIPERMDAIRAASGKTRIYASEWSLGHRVNPDSFGIRNANQLVSAIGFLAGARIEAAAYWPPVKAVPGIALLSADSRRPFANGLLLGWMSRWYRGEALPVSGDLPAAAARSADGVTVFVASMGDGPRSVRIALAGTGLTRIVSAEILFSEHPDDANRSRIAQFAPLPAEIRSNRVEFDLNPGTPGRGPGWEVARVTLR